MGDLIAESEILSWFVEMMLNNCLIANGLY